jgi:hypothetical protein
MTSPARCKALWDSVEGLCVKGIDGSLVECGVWKGGSTALMALAAKSSGSRREIHLFDSFEGLPEPQPVDGKDAISYSSGKSSGKMIPIGKCDASLEEVRRFLKRRSIDEDILHFHIGWFKDTVPEAAAGIDKIALLRLDGDWFESTKICLEHLYPKLVLGGVIILDDYFFWKGCRLATDEYRSQFGITEDIVRIDEEACMWTRS